LPEPASTYALPPEWRRRWGLKRYGFHGLSHAYVSRRAAELAGGRPGLRIVTAHLGAGASLAAIVAGRSLHTTMAFPPPRGPGLGLRGVGGLGVATRGGSVDPGLILWLEEHVGMTPRQLADALEHRSGLLGLAGTADMRELERRAAAGERDARLALEVYLHR